MKDFTLEDYLDTFADMNQAADYYLKLGEKYKDQNLINAIRQFQLLYPIALSQTVLEEAEMYYNDLRAFLFECEELIEENEYWED